MSLLCSVAACGNPAKFQLFHADYYDDGYGRYHKPLGEAFCTAHALLNEIGASGELPRPRCSRNYPLIPMPLCGGWITYKLLSTDDPVAKRAAKLLPKRPTVAWWPELPRDVEAMKELLAEMQGGAR